MSVIPNVPPEDQGEPSPTRNRQVANMRKALAGFRRSHTNPPLGVVRYGLNRIRGRDVILHRGVSVRGWRNVTHSGRLVLGEALMEFSSPFDPTVINVRGKLEITGNFHLGRGARIDIGPEATVRIAHSYINCNSRLIIRNGLEIGEGCAIAWDCEIVDSDFHEIEYPGRREKDPRIVLGSRVWVGAGARILKGARIADGCVIGAGSVVTGNFPEPNCLIAGNPAKVIRTGVTWD